MLSLEDPFDIVVMPGAQAPASFRSFAGGLHTAPASVAHDGRGCGIGIELTALGARRLLGMPASGLAAIVVDLRDLWGTAVDELEGRLLCKPTWLRRVAVLDAILARLASDGADIAPEIAHAWHELSASAGAALVRAAPRRRRRRSGVLRPPAPQPGVARAHGPDAAPVGG